jgi:hypothetical protein
VTWATDWRVIGHGVMAHVGRALVLIDVDEVASYGEDVCGLTDHELTRYGLECWQRHMGRTGPRPVVHVLEGSYRNVV